MDAEGVADVRLAVTEAATNAVLHAYAESEGELRVTAVTRDGELAIVIADTGPGLVERHDSPGLGVGLAVMASLTARLKIVSHPRGTAVHMAFPCPAAGVAAGRHHPRRALRRPPQARRPRRRPAPHRHPAARRARPRHARRRDPGAVRPGDRDARDRSADPLLPAARGRPAGPPHPERDLLALPVQGRRRVLLGARRPRRVLDLRRARERGRRAHRRDAGAAARSPGRHRRPIATRDAGGAQARRTPSLSRVLRTSTPMLRSIICSAARPRSSSMWATASRPTRMSKPRM